jgi:hypothetical protein
MVAGRIGFGIGTTFGAHLGARAITSPGVPATTFCGYCPPLAETHHNHGGQTTWVDAIRSASIRTILAARAQWNSSSWSGIALSEWVGYR